MSDDELNNLRSEARIQSLLHMGQCQLLLQISLRFSPLSMIGVTGSSGFVASSFIKQLNQLGLDYHSFSRSSGFPSLSDPKANYRSHFSGISTLVICSGLHMSPRIELFAELYFELMLTICQKWQSRLLIVVLNI